MTGIELPAAPYEVKDEIKSTAKRCIESEQRLANLGLRDATVDLASADVEEWLRGSDKLLNRLDQLQRARASRALVRWVPAAAVLAAAAGFAVGLTL